MALLWIELLLVLLLHTKLLYTEDTIPRVTVTIEDGLERKGE
jgi:hypothetical protein